MTDDELFAIIEQGLYVDEAVADKKYRHKKRAEYLERAIYVCPFCGLSEFESHDDKLECKKCGRVVKYLETTELVGDGFEHPYRFVADWYDAQKDFINSFDALAHCDEPLYCEEVSVYEVIPCEKKELLSEESRVTLFGDRLILSIGGEDIVCPFEDISSVAVLGRNKLNVYYGDKIYQLKGSKRFNALKYVHIYHRHKNIVKGDANGEFLGL
jgi:ribosomal protein S27AE